MENNQNIKLLKQFQFQNMDKLPLFEINWKDYDSRSEDDYEVFNIQADEHGIYTIVDGGIVVIEWDNTFSLDEHLQELYSKVLEDKLNA
jgi:hypothetical protein